MPNPSNFKIYVPTLDEENLIRYTLEALLKVFPPELIEVIDIGSDDNTLAMIPTGIKVNIVHLPSGPGVTSEDARKFYTTDVLNKFSKKQEWVMWVDGDEIFHTRSLKQIKSWLESAIAERHDEKYLRGYWKVLDQREDGMYCSKEYLSAGIRLFNSNYFEFQRGWPKEVIVSLNDKYPVLDKRVFNGIWFQHGVLLQRSHIEKTARRKKKGDKLGRYFSSITWEKTPPLWEVGYDAETPKKWVVLNMAEGTLRTRWEGELGVRGRSVTMFADDLEINSPEYWELRHKRESWPRTSGWVMDTLVNAIPSRADVLEVGCGQGAFAAKLLELRPDIHNFTAFDISPSAIEAAKKLNTRVNFEVADIFALKGKWPNGFDYVISIQNFEHWPEEQHINALRGAWSRLRPGGRMFFTGVGEAWDLHQLNYSDMEYQGKIIQTPNDYHYNSWSEQSVYDLFMRMKATSVKFWRLRQKDRVVAEAEKSSD